MLDLQRHGPDHAGWRARAPADRGEKYASAVDPALMRYSD
jgi:hypothetical protein